MGQPATTLAPETLTATEGSGAAAGPLMTAPVRALNFDPWHGQSSSVGFASATVQPWWVQTELKATTLPAVGCATMISAPLASLAATAPPTGTLLSATMALAAGAVDDADVGAADEVAAVDEDAADVAAAADDGADEDPAEVTGADDAAEAGADGAAADEGAADGAVVDAEVLLAAAVAELPHAASVSAEAPRPAATSTWRRLIGERGPPVAVGSSDSVASIEVEGAELEVAEVEGAEWAAAELGVVMPEVNEPGWEKVQPPAR